MMIKYDFHRSNPFLSRSGDDVSQSIANALCDSAIITLAREKWYLSR